MTRDTSTPNSNDGQFIDHYLETRASDFSEHTGTYHQVTLAQFAQFLEPNDTNIMDATIDDVQAWVDHQRQEMEKQEVTIQKKLGVLRALYAHVRHNPDEFDDSPAIDSSDLRQVEHTSGGESPSAKKDSELSSVQEIASRYEKGFNAREEMMLRLIRDFGFSPRTVCNRRLDDFERLPTERDALMWRLAVDGGLPYERVRTLRLGDVDLENQKSVVADENSTKKRLVNFFTNVSSESQGVRLNMINQLSGCMRTSSTNQ